MTCTEEIVVSGKDFIERRIFVYPEGDNDVVTVRDSAFGEGYKRGWLRGFLIGAAFVAAATISVWLVFYQ